jgi:hypothetical protein
MLRIVPSFLLLCAVVAHTHASAICVTCLDKCFATLPACSATPAGPIGGAACFIACEVVCVLSCVVTWCFGPSALITVQREGTGVMTLPIEDVVRGDFVLTAEQGQEMWTMVELNVASEGAFQLLNITVGNSSQSVVVTDNHVMVVVDRDGAMLLRPAADLRIGDLLPLTSSGPAPVSRIEPLSSSKKHTLVTSHGTLAVNGVLVSTICADNLPATPGVAEYAPTMAQWRAKHSGMFLEWAVTPPASAATA